MADPGIDAKFEALGRSIEEAAGILRRAYGALAELRQEAKQAARATPKQLKQPAPPKPVGQPEPPAASADPSGLVIPPRVLRDNAVLNMRADGASYDDIAEKIGITRTTVLGILYRARGHGDKRATARLRNGLPVAGAGTKDLRLRDNKVLNLWAKGLTQKEIGAAVNETPTRVGNIVQDARKAGDPRAVRRYRVTRALDDGAPNPFTHPRHEGASHA